MLSDMYIRIYTYVATPYSVIAYKFLLTVLLHMLFLYNPFCLAITGYFYA